MEPLPHTYTANSEVASADLNAIQTRADGTSPATTNNFYLASPAMGDGRTVIEWMLDDGTNQIATATQVLIDDSIDWRDRVITMEYGANASVLQPGTGDDYLFNLAITVRKAYTGLGALNGAGTDPPSNGDPPVAATGTSWAPTATTNLFVYAHPTTGYLYLYNNTGSTIITPTLTVTATAITNKRP